MSWRIKRIVLLHALFGFVCWYSIEKVFERSIGISIFGISVIATIYIVTSIILNIPTGILADKYGRKYALFVASLALLATTIIAGTAHSFVQYCVATVMWGLFYTTLTGAIEAIQYDTLKDEGKTDRYAKYSGISMGAFWVAIFLASLVGAYLGSNFGLRSAYLATIIPNIIAIGVVLSLHEPSSHDRDHNVSSLSMIKQGFNAVSHSPQIVYLSAIFLIIQVTTWSANEFGQLFLLELGFSVLVIGTIWAFCGLLQAGGNFVGYKFGKISNRKMVIILATIYIVTFAIPVEMKLVATALFLLLMFVTQAFEITTTARIQHQLPSKVRATSISALAMISDSILATGFLSFGVLSQQTNVRLGMSVFVIIGIVILVAALAYAKTLQPAKAKATT